MEENKTYTVNTLYLVNGDTIDAIKKRHCPLRKQIVYQFEHPSSDFITIKHKKIDTVSMSIKNILYIQWYLVA